MPKDDLPIRGFDDAAALGRWLEAHHGESAGIWLKIPKKDGGGRVPSYDQAVDEALRFGWIGGQNGSTLADGWRSIRTATQSRRAAASMASRNGPMASMS